ncbi:response regulator [Polyangium mundeleinium]|uniref:Response regulator n=1 Tax=Polyangium mundeleinium TaxID=2995306 RepID=A0ABT5ETX3_9BACT|nr:response regulator [Polyangium mundeleinium]MDC0744787.1 response regulator [Polyangium mundeleinium]
MDDLTQFNGLVVAVDDNPINLDTLLEALSGERLDLAVATDGSMAMSLIEREQPDLVLLDVMLPDIDGFEVCRRLKANPQTADTQVVFMTSLSNREHRLQGLHAGAVDYISKPFDTEELLARIRPHIAVRRMTRALQEKNTSLEAEIRQRVAVEAAREALLVELMTRTDELHEAKERLERELVEKGRANAERTALHEQIIAGQRTRLLELSTPLIPITDRILVMPLIGTMDTDRVQQAIETMLQGASSRSADFIILDITGLKRVDESVASMLLAAASGLRLLGTRTVITGIRSEVARTLVHSDASLQGIVTKATLQDGIAVAMQAARHRG